MDTFNDTEEMPNIWTYLIYMIFCIFHSLCYSWEMPVPIIIRCTLLCEIALKDFAKAELKNESVDVDMIANCITEIQPPLRDRSS